VECFLVNLPNKKDCNNSETGVGMTRKINQEKKKMKAKHLTLDYLNG
jgi:hypothetical protein